MYSHYVKTKILYFQALNFYLDDYPFEGSSSIKVIIVTRQKESANYCQHNNYYPYLGQAGAFAPNYSHCQLTHSSPNSVQKSAISLALCSKCTA